MANILNVAQYICSYYRQLTGEVVDELKLQKLLYLCQREKLAILNETLFDENMEGWIYGPVSPRVRKFYDFIKISTSCNNKLNDIDAYIIRNVVCQYGSMSSIELKDLTHKEYSWQRSRRGLSPDERGDRVISVEDIKVDAEKVRPIDYAWGMYYDEFDDLEVVK